MKTYMANPDKIERKWYVVDASGYTLGRLASEVATVLRGKNKPTFTPHIDTGDYVIVVNAEKVRSESILPSFRLCRRYERDHSGRDDGQEAGKSYRTCCKRHASEGTFRKIYDQETSCICWSGS